MDHWLRPTLAKTDHFFAGADILTPLFRTEREKTPLITVRFNTPMGARILRKIRRYGAGGGVRFRCFTSAVDTSLVSGSSKGEEVLLWWIRRLPCLQRISSQPSAYMLFHTPSEQLLLGLVHLSLGCALVQQHDL